MGNLNVKVVADNRNIMGKFGALYGKQIFTVAKEPCDLAFGSRTQEANDKKLFMPNRPVYHFVIIPIDIISLKLAVDGTDSPVVVINEGMKDPSGKHSIEIRCPLTDPKLANDVTVDTVADAINKGKVTPVYFSNAKRLVDEVNALNRNELSKLATFIEDLNSQKGLLEQTITSNENDVVEYYKELDKKNDVDIHVHVEA